MLLSNPSCIVVDNLYCNLYKIMRLNNEDYCKRCQGGWGESVTVLGEDMLNGMTLSQAMSKKVHECIFLVNFRAPLHHPIHFLSSLLTQDNL